MAPKYASAANAMLRHRYGYVGHPSDYVGSRAWAIDQASNQVMDRMSSDRDDFYEVPIDLAHEAMFGSMPVALRGRVELSPVLAAGGGGGAIRMVPLQPSPRLSPGASEGVDLGFQEFIRHYRSRNN